MPLDEFSMLLNGFSVLLDDFSLLLGHFSTLLYDFSGLFCRFSPLLCDFARLFHLFSGLRKGKNTGRSNTPCKQFNPTDTFHRTSSHTSA
ncbi:hypothetical protein [Candidatus Electrothrix sp.]|uniref:hypothetical protein n=1 Tax=Candidatus Electrothrix sp. TaxID=2170559 RepID=UPI004055C6C8